MASKVTTTPVGVRSSYCTALVLIASLAGCTGPMHYFRFPPGRTQQDFQRDSRLCNLDAQTLQWNTWFGGRTAGQIDRRFVDCMTKLGYVEYDPTKIPAASVPLVLAPPPSPQPELATSVPPTPPQPPPDPKRVWILGQWNSLAGMSGSVDGLAHFTFRREGSDIKWIMTRSGWFSGVQTTQKASGSVNRISEPDLELVGKYDSSNLRNVEGQSVRYSFTRDADNLKGYELADDGTQSSMSLMRAR